MTGQGRGQARAPHRWLDAHQRWAVWGMGSSGIAAANLLARHGKHVTLSDPRSAEELSEVIGELDPAVHVHCGANIFQGATVIVTSPGLAPRLTVFEQARGAGLPVISELELAFDCATAPFVAITGTDGKTTTTSLIGEILEADGREVVVAGNIGIPLCEVVEDVSADGFIVAEVSAFQLWTTHHVRPRFACLTNLADDHLDYFEGDFQAYAHAKMKMVANMRPGVDRLWLNGQDAQAARWQQEVGDHAGEFALSREALISPPPEDRSLAWSQDDQLLYRASSSELPVVLVDDLTMLGLKGRHNVMNMLCAASMCLEMGVSPEVIEGALRTFKGLPHRYELVGEVEGVRFVDDSKATNAHAALAGLRGADFDALVVISGGVDKGLNLDGFAGFLAGEAHAVVLIGQLARRLFRALESAGMPAERIHCGDSMAQAVERAFELAKPVGADVVLSPASSSFDMFESYAHRGDVFQQCVRELG